MHKILYVKKIRNTMISKNKKNIYIQIDISTICSDAPIKFF